VVRGGLGQEPVILLHQFFCVLHVLHSVATHTTVSPDSHALDSLQTSSLIVAAVVWRLKIVDLLSVDLY
jgi:hypothetical protein